MELATAALSSLLPKLGTLLSDQYKLHKGVRGEIKFLQVEMESMNAVLRMFSNLPSHQITDPDKIWLRNLQELSYDIEDSVDTFMVRIDTPLGHKPQSFKRFFDKTISLLTTAKARHHIANDIKDIKKRIQEVADTRDKYKSQGVSAQPDTSDTVDPRVLASFEHATKLVGTDVPVEKISNLLTKENGIHKEKTMVVSIFGVGGLGKTTIANLVYERLGGHFKCKAFVSVSLKPNMKQILCSILRQVRDVDEYTTSGEMDHGDLIRSIRKFLGDKRYFIVIDDVWSEEAWKTIQCILIDNNLGNRVILTTRNIDVAKASSVAGDMYELDPLSYEDSKTLLSKSIFHEQDGILSELEEVTTKILKKCGGIPLAIITIASLLASIPNKTKLEWYGVYKSMGSGLENHKSLENMRKILYLSYDDLPSYLKPCLLYLSMFPEDYEIPRMMLIQLWVAEGFVDDGVRESNLYELGERYFNELVNRSMIQPVGNDHIGNVRGCKVHDMVLDLIIPLSAQENFVTISGDPNLISTAGKIRRLSLQGSEVDSNGGDSVEQKVILPTTVDTSHVRTLFALGDAFQWMPPLSSYGVLRVLVLEYFPNRNNNLNKGLGGLHHLRFLRLKGSTNIDIENLQEIGNLKYLKTLDLKDASVEELPTSIGQLRQLECLMLNHWTRCPDGIIGNLVFLQWIGSLQERGSLMAELSNLTRLRYLNIRMSSDADESCIKTFLQSLSNLQKLHSLLLFNSSRYCLDCVPDEWSSPTQVQRFFVGLSKVSPWFSSLSELSYLWVGIIRLTQDDLQLLGALPMLRTLEIYLRPEGTSEERLVIATDRCFRALTEFTFEHNHKCWLVFAQGVMPKLLRFVLCFRARNRAGGGFDVGLENLTCLKQVKVTVDCRGARIADVEDAETRCRDTIDKHPNHPTLDLYRRHFHCKMMKEDNDNN